MGAALALEKLSEKVARRAVIGRLGQMVAAAGLGLAGVTVLEREAAFAGGCPCCLSSPASHTQEPHEGEGKCNFSCTCECTGAVCSAAPCVCPGSSHWECAWYCCMWHASESRFEGKKCGDCFRDDNDNYSCTMYTCWTGSVCNCNSDCV